MKLPLNFSPADARTRSLDLLVPEFKVKVIELLARCEKRGVKMVCYTTRIGPAWEASLYCHSRQWAQVEPTVAQMKAQGAPRLAALLKPELCKRAEWKSNALPGRSWHSWGEAVDCYVAGPNGQALWVSPGYAVYAEEAKNLGLTAGHYWGVKDSVHVQLRPDGGVRLSWPEVEQQMFANYE